MTVSLTLSLLLLVIPATPALALTGTITSLSPATGPPGITVSITGAGFTPNSIPTVWWSGNPLPTSGTVNGTGYLNATFSVPTYPRGQYPITVTTNATDTTLYPLYFTVTPQIALNYSSGQVGDPITVSGSGFYASSTATIYFDSTAVATTPTTITTASNGTFTGVVFNVPPSIQGFHLVTGYDTIGGSLSVSFTVFSKITVSPASGAVGDNITVSGTGFAADKSIAITFDGAAVTTTPAAVTTDGVGSFSQARFTVPAIARGTYIIRAQDTSGNYDTETFSTTQSITLAPSSGPNGTKVTVNGTGFLANGTITIYFDDVPVTVATVVIPTDNKGSFTTSFDLPTSSGGPHQVKASDGTNTDTKPFTVSTTCRVSPLSGYVGTKVTVSGDGFLANHSVAFTFDGVAVTTTPVAVTTDSKGVLSATTFEVLARQAGTYKIRVSDGTNIKETDFTVTTSATISPVTSTASPGHVGDDITVSGVGFMPDRTLIITYDGKTEASTTVASDGTFSITFPAPASHSGTHTIIASDNVSSISFTFVMEATPPAAPTLSKPEAGTKAKAQATFGWSEVTDPSGVTYTLQIATDAAFTQMVLEKKLLTQSEYTLTKDEKLESVSPKTPYYWRVKAIDGASNESAWSSAGSFYVGFHLSQSVIIYIIIGIAAVALGLLGYWLGQRRKARSE
jgi:hypothetical protein